jgi:gliding motility-associated-like protein
LSFDWSSVNSIISGQNSQNPVVTVDSITEYFVTINNQLGCEFHDSITISTTETNILNFQINPSCPETCTGKIIVSEIAGNPPYSYIWNIPHTGAILDSICSGTYSLTVTDIITCRDTMNFQLSSYSSILISSIFENASCIGICDAEAEIEINGGTPPYYVDWDNGDNQLFTTNLCYGSHIVIVSDSAGCNMRDTIQIGTKTNDFEMPNVISPNGDGINDFVWVQTACKDELEFTVYTRWGTIVFQSKEQSIIWNGFSTAGKLVSPGVYYYVITSESVEDFNRAGFIQVIHD